MAFTNQTTHYGLPQWIGSDKPTYLVDQNNAYQTIDSEIYNANVTAGEAVTTANGASSTAGAASATAADALSAAQTASTTADNALTEAQTANTNAQAAQTAAGAAQTAAQAAQEAAAGNSITNLAPAYDSTITYGIDDLVTQDGKLYKCIVAVTSPEQFDINKWDDVTTSEVYARNLALDNYYTKAQSDNRFGKRVATNTGNIIDTSTASSDINITNVYANDLLSNEQIGELSFECAMSNNIAVNNVFKIGTMQIHPNNYIRGFAMLEDNNTATRISNVRINSNGDVEVWLPSIDQFNATSLNIYMTFYLV